MSKIDVIYKYWLTSFDSRESAIEYFKKCAENTKNGEKRNYEDMVVILENSKGNMVSDGNDYYAENYIFGINTYTGNQCVPYIKFLQPIKYSDYKEMDLKIPSYKKLENDLVILETDYRNNEPIALVQKEKPYHTEYIIAIDYVIENDDMVWAYGHYYYDLETAKKEFDKIKEGGYIDHTNKKQKELKLRFIGIDDWNRFVYSDERNNLYKEVNLGHGSFELTSVSGNDFYGEPEAPIKDNIKVTIIKEYNKQDKEQER